MLMDIDLRKNNDDNDLAVYLAVTSYVLVAYAHVWCRQWILDRVADRKTRGNVLGTPFWARRTECCAARSEGERTVAK
ncbi:unnamed protein product [Lasius platythorax]|uniref:Uncharacterized protein n=1 Tax=Lasius platythorax TaxID=488582 RepID=A0AAV2NVI0_9HYME